MLITHPEKGRNHVDLGPCLGRNMTGTQSQIEILYKKEHVGGELNPLTNADGGSVLSGDGNEEGGNLRAIGVPKRKK